MEAQALRVFATPEQGGRRATSGAIVIALHVGLVVALAYGLKVTVVDAPKGPLTVAPVIIDKPVVDPVKPHPVEQHTVEVYVPKPEVITDDNDTTTPTHTILGPTGQGGGNQAVTSPIGARGIMNTHTIPPYPTLAIRLGEEGVVSLRIVISNEGFVTDADVARSSGHPRLDEAAVAWVKSHWRYHPAQQGGVPVASTASADVRFELRNAR